MDLQKILSDLEAKAIGLKPGTNELQEGFFVSFRKIGEPIREKDFKDAIEDLFLDVENLTDMEAEVTQPATAQLGNSIEGINNNNVVELTKISEEMAYLRSFVLSDDKIRMNPEYFTEPGTSKVSETWAAIINAATIDLSNIKMNDEIDQAFKDLEKLLTPEMIERMDKAEGKHNKALESLVEKYTESRFEGKMGAAKWRSLGKIYQRKVERTLRDFRLASKEYDRISAILDSNGVDPAAFLISKAKTRFNNWSVQLGLTTAKNSKVNAGGGFKLNLGLWKAGAKGGYHKEKQSLDINTTNFKVEFEYMVARVNRPWMDTSILNVKNWYLKSSGKEKYLKNGVSDGSFNQVYKNKPNIFLPSVVTGLILLKDLKIEWEEGNQHFDKMSKAFNVGASVGWGPIKFGGEYSKENGESNKDVELEEHGLSMKGIQLIGYVSEILPASPFLNSK